MIDYYIAQLQHPFFMTVAGVLFFFLMKYSLMVSSKKEAKVHNFTEFWGDQKDEFMVTLVGAMIFLVWDDETLAMWYEFVKGYSPDQVATMGLELQSGYYLLVGFAVERLYWIVQKLRG